MKLGAQMPEKIQGAGPTSANRKKTFRNFGCAGLLVWIALLALWIGNDVPPATTEKPQAKPDLSKDGEPEMPAALAVAKRITGAMDGCDGAYRDYRIKPTKAAAERAGQRCLDATGAIANLSEETIPNNTEREDFFPTIKRCMIAAGARSAWLNGVAYPEAQVSDGEENAVAHNLACINGLIEAAGKAGISPDDSRLSLPIYMDER